MTEGPDWNAFYHDYFLRGDLQRCRLMTRLTKFKASAATNHHTRDPDFYSLPFLPELTQTFCLFDGDNNRPAELLATTTDPAEEKESAAVALLAVRSSEQPATTTTTSTAPTSTRSSSKKRPHSKSNDNKKKSFQKKRTVKGSPPITTSMTDIPPRPTTIGPELLTTRVRNNIPPSISSLALVPPQWSAATPTPLPLQQEQRRLRLATPMTYLPSATSNVFVPSSSSADIVDMEFHSRILRAQEDITRLSSAWMEARYTMAQIATARRNVEARQHSWIPTASTIFHVPTNRITISSSLPAVGIVAVPSSLPIAEPGLVFSNSLQSSAFPRMW